jgi:hypothetical protein
MLGVASWLAYSLAFRMLEARRPSRLSAPLALSAALIASLSASWQLAGRTLGGATLAVAAALGALAVLQAARGRRGWIGAGLLVGLTVAEAPMAGLVAAAACFAMAAALGKLPSLRDLCAAFGAALAVAGLFSISLAARAVSDRVGTTLGTDWSFLGTRSRVGWAWTLRAISSAVNSALWANVNSGSSSVTSGPIIWAPKISP